MGGPKAKLIPDPVENVRDAARCLEWRKRRNAKKCQCKFGKLSIV